MIGIVLFNFAVNITIVICGCLYSLYTKFRRWRAKRRIHALLTKSPGVSLRGNSIKLDVIQEAEDEESKQVDYQMLSRKDGDDRVQILTKDFSKLYNLMN